MFLRRLARLSAALRIVKGAASGRGGSGVGAGTVL